MPPITEKHRPSWAPAARAAELRYRRREMLADYMRAGFGLVICAPALLLIDMLPMVRVGLGFMTLLFALFAWQTWRRQRATVLFSLDGVALAGRPESAVAWDSLSTLRLRFYGSRREGSGGWMELEVASDGGSLKVTSALERFSDVVDAAEHAASRRGLELDPTTAANLAALLGRPVGR